MNIFNSNRKFVFILLFIYGNFQLSHCQSEELTDHIEEGLIHIDEHFSNNEFVLALTKIEELESYTQYISNDRNRLALNLKKAKAHYGNNDDEKATKLLLDGLKELEKLSLPYVRMDYNSYLGEVFSNSKDYQRTLQYHRETLRIATEISDTLQILNAHSRIGSTFFRNQELDSSFFYYSKIVKFPMTNDRSDIMAISYNALSANSIEIGDLLEAEEYGNKALEIRRTTNDTMGIAYALINLSGIMYLNKEFEKSEENYRIALESVKNSKDERAFRVKENVLYNLAYINEELKDFESAYKYLEQATELTDSLAQANVAKNISEISAKYNVEKAATEAEKEKSARQRAQFFSYATIFAFLSMLVVGYIFYRNYRLKQEREVDKLASDAQIKIINATIDAKEKERKSIAEILHDSVSALLSSANLHLQATKAQLKTGYPQEITKAQTIVNEASVKIRDLSHELISSVLLKFGLAFAVHDMCQKYSNSEISLFSDDDGIKRYEQDFEIKIHSIIEELVNNILKHSKAKNATIMLAHRENNMLSIRMNDDGVGFDAKKAKTKGGLGLSHIEARITVMKGVFNIVSSKDNGTSIFILVPIIPRA